MILACTVRACGMPLTRREGVLVCARGHAFDVARSGYVNLLQPQDRRSLDAGDSREAVAARARLFARGFGRLIAERTVAQAVELLSSPLPVVVELGSGTGDVLAMLAERRSVDAVGIDLSVAAADHAARQHPGLTWIVANADRRLPLVDGKAALMLSLHARRNPAECARAIGDGGYLLVAVPGPDDLMELRAEIQGEALERDRVAPLVEEHRHGFEVMRKVSVRERAHLDVQSLQDLLRSSYRGARASAASRVEQLTAMDVTLASELVVFRRR
jgi:23S rRNA (guanine745-N1)-methyltransferase